MTSYLAPRGLSITEQWNTKGPGRDWELWSFHACGSLPSDQPVFRKGSQEPYLPALPPVRGQGVSLYLLHVPVTTTAALQRAAPATSPTGLTGHSRPLGLASVTY